MRSLRISLGGVVLLAALAAVLSLTDPGEGRDFTAGYVLVGLLGLAVLGTILWALLGVHEQRRATLGRVGSGGAMVAAFAAFANGALSVLVPLWGIFAFIAAAVLVVPLGLVAAGCLVAALGALREEGDGARAARLVQWVGWIVAVVVLPVLGGWAMIATL